MLDSRAMVTGLSTPTECKVNEMDSVDMDDGKGLCAALGVGTRFGRVVAKLEEVTCFPERGFFKVRPIPFLCSLT